MDFRSALLTSGSQETGKEILESGKLADFIVLSEDRWKSGSAKVVLTLAGGRAVFERRP